MSSNSSENTTQELKLPPPCKYGSKCYRKNPEHFKHYSHPNNTPNAISSNNSIKFETNESDYEINDPNQLAEKLIPYYKIVQNNNHEIEKNEKKLITIGDLMRGLPGRSNVEIVVTGSKMENKVFLVKGTLLFKNEIICKFGYMKIHFKREMIAQGVPSEYIIAKITGYTGNENLPTIIWKPSQCLADLDIYPESKLLYQIVMRNL